jgi:hypothetical protein
VELEQWSIERTRLQKELVEAETEVLMRRSRQDHEQNVHHQGDQVTDPMIVLLFSPELPTCFESEPEITLSPTPRNHLWSVRGTQT